MISYFNYKKSTLWYQIVIMSMCVMYHRSFNCLDLFSLPAHMILDYASLLLSAAAVDREEKKVYIAIITGSYSNLCSSLKLIMAWHALSTAWRKSIFRVVQESVCCYGECTKETGPTWDTQVCVRIKMPCILIHFNHYSSQNTPRSPSKEKDSIL